MAWRHCHDTHSLLCNLFLSRRSCSATTTRTTGTMISSMKTKIDCRKNFEKYYFWTKQQYRSLFSFSFENILNSLISSLFFFLKILLYVLSLVKVLFNIKRLTSQKNFYFNWRSYFLAQNKEHKKVFWMELSLFLKSQNNETFLTTDFFFLD